MTGMHEQEPVWARSDAFPAAGGGWGWLDRRNRWHECGSVEGLVEAVRGAGSKLRLVATPECTTMVVPEELPELGAALRELGLWASARDRVRGVRVMAVCGAGVLVVAARVLAAGGWRALLQSGWLGGLLLAALIFGAIPWYRGWKEARSWAADNGIDGERVAEARFETWLGMQRAPLTKVLFGLVALVGLLQLLLPGDGWRLAGLVKEAVAAGERWRLLTAPWLHGHPVHWMMNAGALAYLGRRCEVLARWPHLALVYLLATLVGGVASVKWVAAPSVGASGGLLGLLGFLLIFETLHGRLVPVSARRRLLAGVAATALLGLVGFRFIDNAAHAGGLVAGLVYGAIVFPPSASPMPPRMLLRDRVAGSLAVAVLVGSALFAAWKVAG